MRRREWLAGVGASLVLAPLAAAENAGRKAGEEKPVGAVEDLMREHGVLRRALLVYIEVVPRLRGNAAAVDAAALNETARLFRDFGEDYHEKKLEEAHLFPAVRKAGGPAAAYIDVLVAQHQRGREVTDYVLNVTRSGKLAAADALPLAGVLSSFVLMYQNHAAREDTIVFPAWKTALSQQQLEKLGDEFEDIEKQQFGNDGYEEAVKRIGEIEQRLGLADLAQFTPPPPPRAPRP
ncbi:MAG TPA: hemerythrin domain-containing protein [Steroidobacteraceae bacterium]|nr:hemerythrin domain-containing protein [Steroidobacteraceae bacterium]